MIHAKFTNFQTFFIEVTLVVGQEISVEPNKVREQEYKTYNGTSTIYMHVLSNTVNSGKMVYKMFTHSTSIVSRTLHAKNTHCSYHINRNAKTSSLPSLS